MQRRTTRQGASVSLWWGCALSAVLAVPLLGGLFLLGAFGDCGGGVACHRPPGRRAIAFALLIAIGIGFGTRLLVNLVMRRLSALQARNDSEAGPDR